MTASGGVAGGSGTGGLTVTGGVASTGGEQSGGGSGSSSGGAGQAAARARGAAAPGRAGAWALAAAAQGGEDSGGAGTGGANSGTGGTRAGGAGGVGGSAGSGSGGNGLGGFGGHKSCQADADCAGFKCCNSLCANTQNDILNCGGCGTICDGTDPYCNGGKCGTRLARARPVAPAAPAAVASAAALARFCCMVTLGPSVIGCFDPVDGTCPTGCAACVCAAPSTPIANSTKAAAPEMRARERPFRVRTRRRTSRHFPRSCSAFYTSQQQRGGVDSQNAHSVPLPYFCHNRIDRVRPNAARKCEPRQWWGCVRWGNPKHG